jgi:succinate dehydrogenase / fumarate reductase membrane anchor subunit
MSKSSTDMRTPLGRVRGLGAAHEGTGHFWAVRLTAIALIPLTFFVIGLLFSMIGADFVQMRTTLANPFVCLLLLITIGSGLYHMWLGMQEIILDYAHSEFWKYGLLILNTFFVFAIGALCAFSLLKIAFGV